jgi:hypothetical protein
LVKRLSGYWKLELANSVLVPLLLVIVALGIGTRPGPLTAAAIPANVVLLAIGGLYWRAKLHQITGHPKTIRVLLTVLDRMQRLSQVLTTLAVLSAATSWAVPTLTSGLGEQVLITVFAALAVAEYVNYYHRQLQHFDNLPDLRRLVSGRGFRRSKLAIDLARWRSTRN